MCVGVDAEECMRMILNVWSVECVCECGFRLCEGVFVKLFFVRVCRYLRAF